eukprot:5549215-Pyramimonas_sp.AAC.1
MAMARNGLDVELLKMPMNRGHAQTRPLCLAPGRPLLGHIGALRPLWGPSWDFLPSPLRGPLPPNYWSSLGGLLGPSW